MLKQLIEAKIVAVVRANSEEQALLFVDAIYDGGIRAIELTYSIPNVCDVIKKVQAKHPMCLVGVGSVLTKKQAVMAVEAGAKYVVSPGYVMEVQKYCNEHNIIYMPGAMTVSEVINSMEMGNEITKLFPGSVYSPDYIKAIKAPIPAAKLMVTGGVSLSNINEWFQAGVTLVGIGSDLTKSKQPIEITKIAQAYVESVGL